MLAPDLTGTKDDAMPRRAAYTLLFVAAPVLALAQAPKPGEKRPISADDRANIERGIARLETALAPLAGRTFGASIRPADALADASVALKAARWIVKHDEFYTDDAVAKTMKALELGEGRARLLSEGKLPWITAKGGSTRGFVSKIDGSAQPYAVYVPEGYDGSKPSRLDVILHGRDATLTEVKFLLAHEGKPMPEGESGLLLHVFGRGNNAYRWAGETDVLEAIDAVKRNYRVDDRRILLRGFSMGGAGAWHLGLHRPAMWCAVEAGAGFTETRSYARLKELPDYQAKALHIYDAVDYASNARSVPVAGYGGEDDPQKQASQNIVDALATMGVKMTTEGLVTRDDGPDFLRVVGAKTGHKIDAASAEILKKFRDEHAAKGRPEGPSPLWFASYTLKYNDAGWVTIEALEESYAKATIVADIQDNMASLTARNVTILGVDREAADRVKLGEQVLPLRLAVKGLLPRVYFRKVESGWETLDYDQSLALIQNKAGRKRPGLPGPIDDAFTGAFLCVRGTGKPWNPEVDALARKRLERFADEWSEFLRGDLPIKDDADVTDEDVETRHLILFGDPGSNRIIQRVLSDLPLKWTKSQIELGGTYPSASHLPALISARPLNRLKYVVLNSGHTFGAESFRGTNALLYPRLGDWGVLRLDESTAASGYFDERWRAR